jgi:hypothetical protein
MVGVAGADEETIPLSKVPPAVVTAFKTRFPDAVMKAAYKEVDEGKTTYEIESVQKGRGLDVVFAPNGRIESISREIKPGALPAPVVAAVKRRYPRSQVVEASEVTEDGETYIEVIVKKADGKNVTISIDDDGTNLEEEPDAP